MDSGEDLDREVIAERAEELRGWLAGIRLSSRAAGALERELSGIIANDPGGYINGHRPLAGLTVADFVAALHSRNGGAVGQVKSVGDAVLSELRGAIPPDAAVPEPEAPEPEAPEPEAPELETPELETPELETPEPEAPELETPEPEVPSAAPRRRGRPKGSKSSRNGVAATGEPGPAAAAQITAEAVSGDEPMPRRRGRPRREDALAAMATPRVNPGKATPPPAIAEPRATPAPAPAARPDAALDQLARLWPALHPHARRAIVLYASSLLAEAAHEG